MNKLYQRINWQNYPSDSTPLNESNLNKMDAAVDGIDDRVVTLDVTKLPVSTANTMVKDVTFNETTGVFTITKLNGTQVTVNTALEKIATNFRYDYSTQKLILTLIDGTTQEVDLSALLTQYEFLNSSTIQFTIDSSGKVKASVVNGSITGDMLEPNYLANVTLQASKADTSAKNAKESEEKAAEYAESAKNSADSAEPVASTATGANPTIQDSTNAPFVYGKFKGYTSQDGEPTPDNPVEINGLAKDGAIEVKTCGKNLIDDSVVIGKTGVIDTYHKVELEPNKTYYFVAKTTSGDGMARGYFGTYLLDKDGNFVVSYINQTGKYASEFTLTEEQANSIVNCRITANGTQPSDMLVTEVAISETPEYEPYTETTAAIPTDAPLYEGDYLEVYADGSGKLVRNRGVYTITENDNISAVDTSTLGRYFTIAVDFIPESTSTVLYDTISTHFPMGNPYSVSGDCIVLMSAYAFASMREFRFRISRFNTVDELKTWLQTNPVTVVYELAEPTETPLTAQQVEQFKQLYTFEPVTNVLCDGEVEMIYLKNTDGGRALASVRRGVECADTATKATQDSNGNVIADTYAKKSIYGDDRIGVGVKEGTDVASYSCAIGGNVEASAVFSQAFGSGTIADNNFAHAEGKDTRASGQGSHAEGYDSIAEGMCSHVEGCGTRAKGMCSHVGGKYNVEDTENKYAHIVGGGTSDENRKNIHTLDWEGNAEFAGNVVGKNILSSLAECTASTNDTDIASASALAELNNSLTVKSTTVSGLGTLYKSGKHVQLILGSVAEATYKSWTATVIATIPEEYRPNKNIYFHDGFANETAINSRIYIQIQSGGNVSILNRSSNITTALEESVSLSWIAK